MGRDVATTLPTESLAAHGLSERSLHAWKSAGVEALLPLQAKAIMEFGVLQGKSAIIFAPTSSGKTLIAELSKLTPRVG